MNVRVSRIAALAVGVVALGLTGVRSNVASAQSGAPGGQAQLLAQKTQAKTLVNPAARSASVPLDSIAAVNGLTPARFAELAQDPSLWLDTTGRAFYIDAAPPLRAAVPVKATAAPTTAFAPANAFLLHSKPGSSKTIYLDFTGEVLGANAWVATGYTALPMDFDGDGTTFSTQERQLIEGIWARVAEDYAPFDIDVTTEEPAPTALDRASAADTIYGVRALITNSLNTDICGLNCGGVAYVGTFDIIGTNQYYQPAWVFAGALGYDEKGVAEATSHEVGHNLNLNHDGTKNAAGGTVNEYYGGQGSWAPIMGDGYGRPLTQFSSGQYAAANNTENDYSQIAGEGVSLVADEAGSTTPTAISLGAGPSFATSGIISSPTDVDMYSFTATVGQTISFTATPALISPNLDIALTLRNSAGTVIGTYNPAVSTVSYDEASGLDASFSITAPSTGTFYVSVEGVGFADVLVDGYTDYGSVGRFTLTGSRSTSDTTNPVVTISTPVPALATTLQGTATDAGGIVYAQAIIYRGVGGGQFWNGTSWQSGYAAVVATLASPGATSSTWSYVFDPPQSGGTYYAAGLALDSSYNYSISSFVPFTVPDTVAPTAAITSPTAGATVASAFTISGTATDNNAIYGVNVGVYRASDAKFWNGSAWQAGFITVPANVVAPSTSPTGFSYSLSGLTPGYYLVAALPIDDNYNYSFTGWTTVRVP
jgi:Bacterial pre-peptidase C-terminal domain/Bacterial Ig domain